MSTPAEIASALTQAQDSDPDENAPESAPEGVAEAAPPVKPDGTPYTMADIEALQEALRKARKDARAAARGRGVELPPVDGDDSAPDVDKLRAEVESAAVAKWKPLVVRTAARSAFVEAGLVLPKDGADEALARVVRLLDLDDIDVTEDGQVDGLAEQVDEIKRDFPELFASARRPAARVDAGGKPAAPVAPKSSAELLAAQLLGR